MTDALLEMRGVTKRYGSLVANDVIDFSAHAGEIHGLLGENGAGKTTLMRILSGFTPPDAGEIRIDGEPVRIRDPQHAMSLGIGMVHQNWRLVERFTVTDNMMLGQARIRDRRDLSNQIRAISERFGLGVRPEAHVWELSLGERQRVEILRVLQRGARLLILDEPTAVLTPPEVDQLFKVVEQMATDGKAVILISHKLKEVMRHCRRITVLRHGRVVGQRDGITATASELAQLAIGRSLDQARVDRAAIFGPVALELDSVQAVGDAFRLALKGVTLRVRASEILGVAGVSGNGQRELAEVCAGLRRPWRGVVRLCGREITGKSAAEINRDGLAFIPEDRLGSGVCPGLGVGENLILRAPEKAPFARWGVITWPAVARWAEEKVAAFDIRLPDLKGPIRRLSGGNMQKVVLARELGETPKILVAAQPTRGLDVAATEAVHAMLMDVRNRGGAILLISEDLDEILKLSDRLIVLHGGEVMGEFTPQASREEIGFAMTGVAPIGSATHPGASAAGEAQRP